MSYPPCSILSRQRRQRMNQLPTWCLLDTEVVVYQLLNLELYLDRHERRVASTACIICQCPCLTLIVTLCYHRTPRWRSMVWGSLRWCWSLSCTQWPRCRYRSGRTWHSCSRAYPRCGSAHRRALSWCTCLLYSSRVQYCGSGAWKGCACIFANSPRTSARRSPLLPLPALRMLQLQLRPRYR